MDEELTREDSSPIKILLIEDNPADARLVREMLAEAKDASFKLEWASRVAHSLKLLSEKHFDIILLDMSLPDGSGLKVLEKAQAQFPKIPIVLLTGTFDEESMAIMAFQGGAQDYLFKGNTDSNLLIRSIKYAIERKRVEEALRNAYNELELRVQERTEELEKANQALQTEIVERKRAEEEVKRLNRDLKRRLDEMQALLDVVPVGIAVAQDPECKLITVNPAAADMLGIGLDENASKSRSDADRLTFKLLRDGHEILPEELPMQYAAAHNVSIREMELDIVHDNGRVVNSYEYASPLYDEQGNVRGCIGVFVDITERKRVEREVRESLLQLAKKNRYETIVGIVTRSVHRSLNLQEVLENAVDAMSKNMDLVENVCIYMVEREDAVLKAYRNLPDWYIERAGGIPYPRGFTWKTIIDGKPVYCPDVERDTIIGPAGRKLGTKSYLSMPIHYEGRTVGALIVHSSEENAFDEEELKLFEIVARQIEIAINNAKYVQASRESEERLKLALACADMGTWRWDLTTDTDYRGANMNRIMGLEPVESSEPGDKFMGLIHPDDRTEAKKVFERIRQEGGDYLAEFRIIRPDGTTIWLRNQGKTIYGENGKPLYVTGASIDITNRKRVEEEILRRIQQQAVVAKVGQLALAGTDINTLMNEATALVAQTLEVEYCKVLELLPNGEELLLRAGVGWKEGYVGHATVGSGTDSQAGYTLISNEPVLVEDLRRETRFSGPPLLHEHGVISGMSVIIPGKERPYGVIGTHTSKPHNFTQEDAHFIQAIANILAEAIERKHMEEALRESQRVLTTLITNLPGMAYRIRNDQNWTVEFASGGCTDLTGYPPEDFISGKLTWIQIMHTDDIKRILDEVQDAINEEKNYELTYRIRTAEGKEKWVWEKGTGVLGPDGSLLAMEGFVTDITERKMAEEQVRASLREKEVLLKEIHHRVKNNLQIISSLLNLQSRTVKGKKALEKFKESQNRVKSMALIHEKLYQSKDLDRVNFAEYIRSLLSYLFNSYGAGSSVKLKIEVDDIFMNIDKAIPCGLIINEIVSNSLKYAFSEANGGEIRVHCKEDGGIYTLIIKNDGAPFPEKLDFRKTKSLGLQLVCALVEQLRGSIELDRADGTEFRITFS